MTVSADTTYLKDSVKCLEACPVCRTAGLDGTDKHALLVEAITQAEAIVFTSRQLGDIHSVQLHWSWGEDVLNVLLKGCTFGQGVFGVELGLGRPVDVVLHREMERMPRVSSQRFSRATVHPFDGSITFSS